MATYAARLKDLEKRIAQCDRKLKTAKRKEVKAREAWTKRFRLYAKRSKIYRGLKDITTIKAKKLRDLMDWWDNHGWEFTKKRDRARAIMANIEKEKTELDAQKRELIARVQAEVKTTDEIIETVRLLRSKVGDALYELDVYTHAHCSSRLIGPNGKILSQVTLSHSNGRWRITINTRAINRVLQDRAVRAIQLIQEYNRRIRPLVEVDEITVKWQDLIDGLLIEQTKFKIGRRLGEFLGTVIDKDEAPELVEAQHLLGSSLTSERTEPSTTQWERDDPMSPYRIVPLRKK